MPSSTRLTAKAVRLFPVPRGTAAAIARGLWLLARLAAHMKHEQRLRRAQAELAALDDHALRDIGVTRHDIEHAVRTGRFDGA